MSVTIPSKPLIPKKDLYSLDIRSAISQMKGSSRPEVVSIAGMLDKIQSSSNRLEKAIREASDNTFDEIIIRKDGALIGWVGSRAPYSGAWFKQLYVGSTGPDTAPLFADESGNVIIGKNGSLAIQDTGANEVGWLGVQSDASKAVTGATNATPIVVTSAAHGYENGDTVLIANVGGNTAANGYRIVKNKAVNTFELTDLSGVNVAGNGAYTTGGTATRYFGGGRFQTIAIGSSFTNYKIRAFADGQVKIKDALITLTDATNNGYIELNPSTGPDALFRNTSTGYQVEIVGGVIDLRNYITPGGVVSIDYSGYRQFNTALAQIVTIGTSINGGQINVNDASGSGTIGLNGTSGTVSGFIADISTTYKIGGATGVTDSHDVVTDVVFTTGTAVNSVDFTAETTTSTTVVTGITVTTVARAWTSGLLTT